MSDLCPSPCEPDCDFDCHEWHRMAAERAHDPFRCPGATESGLRRDLDEALEAAETPAEGCGQCETDPAHEALSDRPGGRDGPPADEPSTPDPGMPPAGPQTGPGATHTAGPVPHGGQADSEARSGAQAADPAMRLRAAADLIERRAAAATPGPWQPEYAYRDHTRVQAVWVEHGCDTDTCEHLDCHEGTLPIGSFEATADNEWAVLMGPQVAAPLAAWLRQEAAGRGALPGPPIPLAEWPALAVADVILGEETR